MLPKRLRILDPKLLFRSETDGFSLVTLLDRCRDQAPTVLLISSKDRRVFGAFVTDPWQTGLGRPYGGRDCFLFTIYPVPKKVRGMRRASLHMAFRTILKVILCDCDGSSVGKAPTIRS